MDKRSLHKGEEIGFCGAEMDKRSINRLKL